MLVPIYYVMWCNVSGDTTFTVTTLRILNLKQCTAIILITVNPKAFHSVTSLFVIHTQFGKREPISGERNLLSGVMRCYIKLTMQENFHDDSTSLSCSANDTLFLPFVISDTMMLDVA